MPGRPKVSVHIVTYNQAGFIKQALDSVLAQQTPFEFEILVGDDCSTDGTARIVKDYGHQWPDRIKPLLREKNIGPGPNAVGTLEQCTGDYIAFLEGDDYWTDPGKLQIQAAYLDEHPDCALCHHAVEHISWPGGKTVREFPPLHYRRRSDGHDLAKFNYLQTCSVMYRRACLPPLDDEFRELKIGDWPLFVLLSQRGWIGYIDRMMACYRVHASNAWNNRPPDYKIRAMEGMAWYLVKRVNDGSKNLWKDTILALAFKDFALNLKSLAFRKSVDKFRAFVSLSMQLRRPFWLLNALWPYYRANYIAGRNSTGLR